MGNLIGLIPAAGKGTRARPYTNLIPKSMLEVHGRPNLERNICLMRDALGIRDIYIVIGYFGEVIREYFKNGEEFGVSLHYITNNEVYKGLAWSIYLGHQHINDYFCVILSDECYINSNHEELLTFPYQESLVTCAIKHVEDTALIEKNYAVTLSGRYISSLTEKPREIENNFLGCGTFIFSPEIFPDLAQFFYRADNDYVEFVTFLNSFCSRGQVQHFALEGYYVNINDRDSLNQAKYHERSVTFHNHSTTLLLYSEGAEKNIDYTINSYRNNNSIDAIYVIVPHTNTIEATVRACGAHVIRCPSGVELYGEKIKYGMDHAPGDILFLSEAEYTFPERDIDKLLAYLRETDMVIGTRTTRQLIEQGSDMRGVVRLANVLLAKLLELFWWQFEGRLTDVGCTFRAIWRSSYEEARLRITSPGPEFAAEMVIELLRSRKRIIEIPVNYYNRNREMQKKYRNINTFFRIITMIIKKRFFLPPEK